MPPEPAPLPEPELEVPATFAEVVQALDARGHEVQKALSGKRIADLYAACDAITKLAQGLVERAEAESRTDQDRVVEASKAMQRAAGEARKKATMGSFSEATAALETYWEALKPLSPAE